MTSELNIFSRAIAAITPQMRPLANTVPNAAGGYAFAVDDWARLDRFLILGTEGGSDAGMLDVVGVDTATPAVIADFIRRD